MVESMLIDANIFLEVLLEQQSSGRCKAFLNLLKTGEQKAILTTFSIDSIILSMYRERVKEEKIKIFLRSLSQYKGLKIYSISLRDRFEALDQIKRYNLDYEDAITLQAAISTKCSSILSFDRHFDRVKELKREEP
ncbi:MAG: type II toxin-antitoxin system VapC family toxin [Nanoarchaeota archaeon]|nr:type II toxin-antitoxin system VapC family toxin [Nanoarchaeota archaeon]